MTRFEGVAEVGDARHLDSAAARWWHGPRTQSMRVVAEQGRLLLDGETVAPEDHRYGYLQPVIGVDTTRVLLFDAAHRQRLEITTTSRDEAQRLIAALGSRGDQQRVRFGSTRLLVLGLVMVLATIAASVAGAAWVTQSWWLLPLVVLLGAVAAFAARHARFFVSVAPDGILVEKRGRPARFIPWQQVVRAEEELRSGIVLTLASGERLQFELESEDRYFHDDIGLMDKPAGVGGIAQRDAMLGRIREAMAVVRSDALAAELALAGRNASAWLQHLRNTISGGHRTAAPNDDQLWRIVEDGHADPSARAAAAHLLRARIDDEQRTRLRVIAGAAAQPQLRICLESVAAADEELASQEALAAFAGANERR